MTHFLEKTIPEAVKKDYLIIAQKVGFDTADLVWVEQD